MKQNGILRHVCRVVFLAALLVPGWQVMNAGKVEDKDVVLPWKVFGHRTGECGWENNKTIAYYGLDNSGYSIDYENEHGVWGKLIERHNKSDGEKVMVYIAFYHTRTLPPYAREDMYWQYYFCGGGSKTGKEILYHPTDSLHALKEKWNNHTETSSKESEEYGPYTFEEFRHKSSNAYDSVKNVQTIVFDNSDCATPRTIKNWLLAVCALHGSNDDGYSKVGLRTDGYSYNLYYPEFNGAGTKESPLQISSGSLLRKFATIINSGADGTANLYAVLINDIDYTQYTDKDAMIGTSSYPFKGVFDGQGHTIQLAIDVPNTQTVGLFQYVNGATLKNMKVGGSVQGSKMTAALVGDCRGSVSISNVIANAAVLATSSGGLGNAGLVAVGNDAQLTITNCGMTGSLVCTNSSEGNSCAGLVGSTSGNSNLTISNSYFAPTEIKNISTSSGSTFVRSGGTTTITNCYYTQTLGTAQGTRVSEAQMASGEVCWRLNGCKGGGSPWLQTLEEDDLPVLWDALMVYERSGSYFNFEPSFRGAGTELDPFQIESLEQLMQFRDMVNTGYNTFCAKLVTDIDLANRNWEPMGRGIKTGRWAYEGVFDGNGYIISNLNVNPDPEDEELFIGLFGRVQNATIKNLIIKNATFNFSYTTSSGRYAAPIAAYVYNNTTIANCATIGVVSYQGGATNSGIATMDSKEGSNSMSNCYSVYSNVSANNKGISNCYYGNDVLSKHATGELTFLLNNGDLTPWVQTLDRDDYPLLRGALSVGKSGSSYVNLEFSGSAEEGFINNTSGKDFRVIHHGGHLYEFVITMATQDGAGQYICPTAAVSYSDGNAWTPVITLSDVNADSLDFSQDWWGKINIEKGTIYDTKTYDRQVPTFWIRQGNHTTCKQTSLLWVAPRNEAVEFKKFRIKGTAADSQLLIESPIETTQVPGDDAGLTLVDPFIATSSTEAGAMETMITSTNGSYSLGLWDATDDYFISTQEFIDGTTSIEAFLPQQDRNHNIVALMFTRSVLTDDDGKRDTIYTNYAYPFREQPVHSIVQTNVNAAYNANPQLDWAIAFPQDSDYLYTDQYMLARGYRSDYSDISTIASFGVLNQPTTQQRNDSTFAWYSYTDDSTVDYSSLEPAIDTMSIFDTWNISQSAKDVLGAYQYPAQFVYYKAYRPMVNAVWGESDHFMARWKVLQREVLPTVDSVCVIKDPNFDTNHKVTVRIVLNNPYPWELVDSKDQSAVMDEAIRQHFSRRMFTWDNSASILMHRFSMEDEYDEGKDVIEKEISISGDQVKQDSETGAYYVEYQDVVSMPFVHYYYKAKVSTLNTSYPIIESRNQYVYTTNPAYTEEFGGIYNLKATRGSVKGAVEITWEADETANTTLELRRREYQRGYESTKALADWTTIEASNGIAYDDLASAAVVNEYILSITTRYRNIVYTDADTTYGYAAYYGSLDGRVKMSNGVNMPGNVGVSIHCNDAFVLNQVNHPKTGEQIMPACHYDLLKYDVKTDANGAYALDSVPYYGTGHTYTIYATCEGATFVSPTGSSSTIDLTYEDANYTYSNIDFTCNDTRQFSGRILYTNSTVPVRDVMFKVNGTILRDAEGEAVVTDAMGNFSFNVPRMEVTIQAYRQGHSLSNDGYILGGDDGQQRTFTPTHDYDGLIIDDDTRIRLVGRVTGGDVQGNKPMGFGLGHNNLGDSITLVLTLEGDHTSYLYFDKQNPDKLSDDRTYTQAVTGADYKQQRIPTNVTFEAKRIVIKADNKTGEFCLDLFPTKYVVSQIYANGYSTLYSAGEGLTVLDLTDSVGVVTRYHEGDSTRYDASFCKVYHAPVQVELLQLRNNKYQAIYGEQTLEVGMLSGTQQMQLSWMDDTHTAHYTMGYPVYKHNKQYFFCVSAYEPYYYNNVSTGAYERVPMENYPVTVSNGLSDENLNETQSITLNENGVALFAVMPNNATFELTGEEALRYIYASVDVNGYHYESDHIGAYVTGERDYQVEVVDALEGAPQILDYIRDPYGAGSYAYRSEGTVYHWGRNYTKDYKENCEFSISAGMGIISTQGAGFSSTFSYDWALSGKLDAVTKHELTYKKGEFSLELGDKISTSAEAIDQGAIADVYIGSVSTADVVKYQAFSVVDSMTYQALIPAIETGAARLVREGEDEKGHPSYLVICGGVTWQPGEERVFAYSQRYITHMLIPNLEARRGEQLRLAGSMDEAMQMAASSGRTFYYQNAGGEYIPIYPSTMTVRKDTVQMLTNQIQEWQNVIAANEKIKYEVMSTEANKKYSIAGASIEHTEEASTYYRKRTVDGPKTVTGSFSSGTSGGNADPNSPTTNVKGYGLKFDFSLGGGVPSKESTNEMDDYTSVKGGSGFVIAPANDAYFDMDVYYEKDESIIKVNGDFKSDINAYEGGSGLDDYKVTSTTLQMTDDNTYVHSYIFVMRGGATREPWVDADSSLYYFPDGKNSVPLGTRTLKIDKPTLYIENPVINNLPQDEKAVFTIHMSNESEIDVNVKEVYSTVWLHVVDETNPYGAKFSIDGEPLHGNMSFLLDPGHTLTKTLEVERGSAPYDYDNIQLDLSDEVYFEVSSANISIHYLPTATPVTLTQPAQNFLINTLSQTDEEGKYYIPVQIEGFSTTKYENFDHIELQYKRQTDGEDQWITQCSYYISDSLYARATGNKAMIETEGKITNLRFYGEQDPVEQKYDLRAVSFCRLGNGYTTRMSSVISGTKDTRCPEVFGLPKPADGILSFDDVISLPFTEPIAYNYLDETANFSVQGYTNNSDVDNSVALYFSGSKSQKAITEVDRVLNAMDFSIEAMVKLDTDAPDSLMFMLIHDEYSTDLSRKMAFAYFKKEDKLIFAANGRKVYTKPLYETYGINLTSAMTHVGMTYTIADSMVHFYVGEQEADIADACKDVHPVCHANGSVYIGYDLKGKINNIRLWSKALNLYEMTSKYKKRLSANEANLLAYWPADEASGTIVKDIANGANLNLTNVSWSLPDGYSVDLDHKTMTVLSDQALKYTRNNREDYTISFYFKVDALDGDANLFAAGSDALEETGKDKVRIRFVDGVLYFISEGQQVAFGDNNDYASDGTWHYLAVSVNHAQNKAALFIDGALVNQVDANQAGGVAGSSIIYGDANMAAHIDQVQMWSMALPASYIKSYCNAALTGKEKELQIYLPFEQETMNSQGTMYTTFSPLNQVIVESTGEIAGDTVINPTLVTADNQVIAPVRSSTGIENLPFTWKSTDNELQITINKANAEINNQNINLVVRRVEDLNGNPMANAQMWTTYVNRNVLDWVIDPRSVLIPYGHDTTIVAAFKNFSGRELTYTIESNCPFVALDRAMGVISPLSTQAVSLTLSDGMAPGVYEATINLTDEDGLCSALSIYINVEAHEPDWQTTTDPNYNQSMNMIAVVKKMENDIWTLDMSKKDKVAAFIDKECVGVANLSVDDMANTSYLFMTIRGKTDLAGKEVEFRLWDALSGDTYILSADSAITFVSQSIVGADQPVELRAYEMRVQTISLNPGWNWISCYVDPFADKGLNYLFSYQKELTEGDIFLAPFGNTFASFQSNDTWDATLDDMAIAKSNIYQIYAQYAANVEVSGSLYNEDERAVTLRFDQSEWAQMAYLMDQSLPIRQALSDFVAGSEKAPAGTVIKDYNEFAIATDEGTWMGSLEYMRPGHGYFVRRNGLRDSVVVHYYASASAPARKDNHQSSIINRTQSNQSPTMMPIIAAFADGDMQQGDILLAMVGKEVVAVAEATDNLFFVSLHAAQGETVQFAKVRDGEVVAVTSQGLKYDAEGQAGTVEHPYLIDFSGVGEDAPVHDILGLKYDYLDAATHRVLIQGNKKVIKM